jgi:SAM-dependent methyltransferase
MDHATPAADLVAEHWGKAEPEIGRDFYTFPPLVERYMEQVIGERRAYSEMWLEDWACDLIQSDLGRRPSRVISLCCGFGALERYLAERRFFDSCTAYDLSPGAIEQARRQAAELGVTAVDYRTSDLNRDPLPPESCDVVWANGALHHIQNLEFAVDQIFRALRPGGVLFSCEYVGPAHMHLSQRRQDLVNAAIHLLPERLRGPTTAAPPPPASRVRRVVDRLAPPRPEAPSLPVFWRYDERYFRDVDPSEAVRSDEVIGAVRRAFPDTVVRPFGGGIVQYALSPSFYTNFRLSSDADRGFLSALLALDEAVIGCGEYDHDNAVIYAR